MRYRKTVRVISLPLLPPVAGASTASTTSMGRSAISSRVSLSQRPTGMRIARVCVSTHFGTRTASVRRPRTTQARIRHVAHVRREYERRSSSSSSSSGRRRLSYFMAHADSNNIWRMPRKQHQPSSSARAANAVQLLVHSRRLCAGESSKGVLWPYHADPSFKGSERWNAS